MKIDMAKIRIDKAFVEKITDQFELKVAVELQSDPRITQGQKLSFRGVDFPEFKTEQGQKIYQYLEKVLSEVSFVAIKKYGKDPLLRYSAEVFCCPGEEDPDLIVERGRCLNQELLDLALGKPYDESKRKIDFSKKTITVSNQEIDLVTGNFKAEVCMYINDCKQYLRAAIERKPVDMRKGEFDPTDEEFLIIYGLKELKEMCMRLAGRQPLDWQGN